MACPLLYCLSNDTALLFLHWQANLGQLEAELASLLERVVRWSILDCGDFLLQLVTLIR